MRRIIVLGGLGLFGRTAVTELRQLRFTVLTASRRPEADLQIDANDAESIRGAILHGDIVVDAAGPFHSRSMAIIEAAIEVGFHVIDLNDDLGYAEQVYSRENEIAAAGICALSSASSVSAVSAAVIRYSGIDLPTRLTSFLAPATRYTANAGTAQSLWRSVGRPVRVLIDGQLQTRVGWIERRPFVMPQPVGKIDGHLFESADAVTLPRCWPSLREVAMYVDSNTFGANSLLEMAAHSEPLRELMQSKMEWGTWLAKKLGATAGGIGYEVQAADGRIDRFAITASTDSFLTAVAPAVLAASAIASGRFSEEGLVPAHRQVDPDELFTYLTRRGVVFCKIE